MVSSAREENHADVLSLVSQQHDQLSGPSNRVATAIVLAAVESNIRATAQWRIVRQTAIATIAQRNLTHHVFIAIGAATIIAEKKITTPMTFQVL